MNKRGTPGTPVRTIVLVVLSSSSLLLLLLLLCRGRNKPVTAEIVSPSAFRRVVLNSGHLEPSSPPSDFADASARGAKDIGQAKERYLSSHVGRSSIGEDRRRKVEEGVRHARVLVEEGLKGTPYASWISALAGESRWKVAILVDRAENGYPHTVGDLICIPLSVLDEYDVPRLGRLFLHERVHVVQRADPEGARRYAKKLGYERTNTRRRDVSSSTRFLLRANPDLDEWMYLFRGTMPAAVYTSDHPRSLAEAMVVDTKTGKSLMPSSSSSAITAAAAEHPHEAVAYDVVDSATGRTKRRHKIRKGV